MINELLRAWGRIARAYCNTPILYELQKKHKCQYQIFIIQLQESVLGSLKIGEASLWLMLIP